MRIAVAGCGFAGAASALLLAREGHELHVFEAVDSPGPAGAGILLQPSGQSVLQELGLLPEVRSRSSELTQLRARRRDDREVFCYRYASLDPSMVGLGTHRGVLFEALYRAVVDDPNIQVTTGVYVSHTEGAMLVEDSGAQHGPFDLIIGADGARSQLRDAHFRNASCEPYPYGALWLVTEDIVGERFELAQRVHGTKQMFGLLPSGEHPEHGYPVMSLFWSLPMAAAERVRSGSVEDLKDAMRALAPEAAPFIDQVKTHEDLTLAQYWDVQVPRADWGRVVLVGDAMHAMSPQLGQGTNLALLDARALRDALRVQPDLGKALRQYNDSRRAQIGFYRFMSRQLTPLFQSDMELVAPFRDYGFPIFEKVPPLRRYIVRTMAGLKQGFFT